MWATTTEETAKFIAKKYDLHYGLCNFENLSNKNLKWYVGTEDQLKKLSCTGIRLGYNEGEETGG
jgi:hypothetical protein